jgi:mannose-6-phosphate isomerase-like protein (cupin superfamily)
MNVSRFSKEAADPAHNGTILASAVLPQGMKAPFHHAWGYVEGTNAIEPHAHPSAEIYMVFQGEGFMTIGGETCPVSAGDIIEIPANQVHSIQSGGGPMLWAALWWMDGAE